MKLNAKTNKTKNMCHIDGNMSHIKKQGGITLIALVITLIVPYDKMKECCNM